MSGYPGVSWPDAASGAQGNRDARPSESAVRALREERAILAQEIGEYLYRLVMSGQVRDPAVIAACRPLYDMEQLIQRMEAMHRSAAPAPPAVPRASTSSNDAVLTALIPGQRSAWQSGPPLVGVPGHPAPASTDARHAVHARAADRECSHCRMPLKATDRVCPVCGRDTADARPLAPVAAVPATAAAPIQCPRCRMALRAQDRTCPVCGAAAVTSSE